MRSKLANSSLVRCTAGVIEHAKLRSEALDLLLPVEHQRFGNDHQRRSFDLRRGSQPRRLSSKASTCAVLPTPMSSARQPPKENWRRKSIQPRPSR